MRPVVRKIDHALKRLYNFDSEYNAEEFLIKRPFVSLVSRGIRLGISDYVVKPTTRDEIMRRIRLQADAVRKQHEADSMIINFPRRQRA